MTTITALPTPPSSSSPSNFDTRADAFLGALPTFVTQTNAVAGEVNTNATTATAAATNAGTQAATATAQAVLAAASAAAAAASASATLWVSGTNYTAGAVVYSPTNYATYRTTTSGVSSTDPAADTTGRWVSAMLPTAEAVGLPAVRPSLLLDFVNSTLIDPRLRVTRSTTKTAVSANGLVVTVPANTVAVDHDPTTRRPLGLRMESARSNLLTYPQTFTNGVWVKSSGGTGSVPVVTANAATAPDGTVTASTVVFDAGAGTSTPDYSFLRHTTFSVSGGVTYTSGVWIKGAAGAVLLIRSVAAGSYTSITLTGGWQYFTHTESAASANFELGLRQGVVGTINGSVSVSLWAAQLAVQGPTSYIPDGVSRAADGLEISGADFASAWSNAETTLVIGWQWPSGGPSISGGNIVACVSDGTAGNSHMIYGLAGDSSVYMLGSSGAATQYALSAPLPTGASALALALAPNDVARAAPGVVITSDASASLPSVTRMHLGCYLSTGLELNGWLRFVALYPKRLTSAELQALAAAYS